MPKRKRSKELRPAARPASAGATSGASASGAVTVRLDSEQERAARLFAESIRAHEAADRATRDREDAAAQHERRHAELLAAKEAAAARLRRLRTEGRPRQQMADADADYRTALAALTEFETGERPHWAPVVPAELDRDDASAEPGLDADPDEAAPDQPS